MIKCLISLTNMTQRARKRWQQQPSCLSMTHIGPIMKLLDLSPSFSGRKKIDLWTLKAGQFEHQYSVPITVAYLWYVLHLLNMFILLKKGCMAHSRIYQIREMKTETQNKEYNAKSLGGDYRRGFFPFWKERSLHMSHNCQLFAFKKANK